jgi:hypothetical protein
MLDLWSPRRSLTGQTGEHHTGTKPDCKEGEAAPPTLLHQEHRLSRVYQNVNGHFRGDNDLSGQSPARFGSEAEFSLVLSR